MKIIYILSLGAIWGPHSVRRGWSGSGDGWQRQRRGKLGAGVPYLRKTDGGGVGVLLLGSQSRHTGGRPRAAPGRRRPWEQAAPVERIGADWSGVERSGAEWGGEED